jgi:hypothetical protein
VAARSSEQAQFAVQAKILLHHAQIAHEYAFSILRARRKIAETLSPEEQ